MPHYLNHSDQEKGVIKMRAKVTIGKPVTRPNRKNTTTICGYCGYTVRNKDNYCSKCGAKLDWSDFSEEDRKCH